MTDGEPNVQLASSSCLPPLNVPGNFDGFTTSEPLCYYQNVLSTATTVKNAGIHMYSIGHKLVGAEKALMEKTASYPEWYFDTIDQATIDAVGNEIFGSTCGG